MRKVAELMKIQARTEFNEKKKQVIHNVVRNIAERNNKRFEDVLAAYMGNN